MSKVSNLYKRMIDSTAPPNELVELISGVRDGKNLTHDEDRFIYNLTEITFIQFLLTIGVIDPDRSDRRGCSSQCDE